MRDSGAAAELIMLNTANAMTPSRATAMTAKAINLFLRDRLRAEDFSSSFCSSLKVGSPPVVLRILFLGLFFGNCSYRTNGHGHYFEVVRQSPADTISGALPYFKPLLR
jgi:hypothetical protein